MKTRIDQLLVARGLFDSRSQARAAIEARVLAANGQPETREIRIGLIYRPAPAPSPLAAYNPKVEPAPAPSAAQVAPQQASNLAYATIEDAKVAKTVNDTLSKLTAVVDVPAGTPEGQVATIFFDPRHTAAVMAGAIVVAGVVTLIPLLRRRDTDGEDAVDGPANRIYDKK